MSTALLTTSQCEALQEIANIGMGQAGSSIAGVLNEFVCLSIPRILMEAASAIPAAIQRLVGDRQISVVRQAFHGELRGEVMVVFGLNSSVNLGDLLGYGDNLDGPAERELLLDLSNVLVGACLGGIAEQLRAEIGYSAPSFMVDRVAPIDLMKGEDLGDACALLVEVNFKLEHRSFACHLIILMPEDEIRSVGEALDKFISSL